MDYHVPAPPPSVIRTAQSPTAVSGGGGGGAPAPTGGQVWPRPT